MAQPASPRADEGCSKEFPTLVIHRYGDFTSVGT